MTPFTQSTIVSGAVTILKLQCKVNQQYKSIFSVFPVKKLRRKNNL